MKRFFSIAPNRRTAAWRRSPLAVVVGVIALALRLAAPMPAPGLAAPSGDLPSAALIAAFGEHAFCLAQAGQAQSPADRPGAPSDNHAAHHANCCLFHAALGSAPPATGIVVPALYEIGIIVPPPAPPLRRAHFANPAQARAPPLAI